VIPASAKLPENRLLSHYQAKWQESMLPKVNRYVLVRCIALVSALLARSRRAGFLFEEIAVGGAEANTRYLIDSNAACPGMQINTLLIGPEGYLDEHRNDANRIWDLFRSDEHYRSEGLTLGLLLYAEIDDVEISNESTWQSRHISIPQRLWLRNLKIRRFATIGHRTRSIIQDWWGDRFLRSAHVVNSQTTHRRPLRFVDRAS